MDDYEPLKDWMLDDIEDDFVPSKEVQKLVDLLIEVLEDADEV